MDPLIGSQSNYEMDSHRIRRNGSFGNNFRSIGRGIPSIFNDILADKKAKPEQISLLFNKRYC